MDEKKNIDRLFQEKFKDFEVIPDTAVWKNIEKQFLKKKKRRIIPLWLRFAGAAAILLLLVSTGFWYFNENKNALEQPEEIIITDTGSKDENNEKPLSDKEENAISYQEQNNQIKVNDQEESGVVRTNQTRKIKTNTMNKAQQLVDTKTSSNLASQERKNIVTPNVNKDIVQPEVEKLILTDKNIAVAITKERLNSEKTIIEGEEIATTLTNAKEDIQSEIDKLAEAAAVTKNIINKWSIGSTLAPIYYNTSSNGSPIDPALANNRKNGDESISYGLKVNYKLSNRLSLQSGINTVELGYSTENVAALISSSLLSGTNTNVNSNIDGIAVAAISTANSLNSDVLNQRSSFDLSGNLDQTLGYVEIPIEAKYNILQKKLGVNVIGGFSTYFLYENKVSITSFGKTNTLGEASNINTVNFSGNVGVDFDYNISKKLYINVSPMFKYQFNTYSRNSGGFQPYYLGIYTGLNFRF